MVHASWVRTRVVTVYEMDGWSGLKLYVHDVDSDAYVNAQLRHAVESRGDDVLVDVRNFTDPGDAFPQPQNEFLVHNYEKDNGVGDSFCKANSDLGRKPGLQRLVDHLFAGGAVVTGEGEAVLAPCPTPDKKPMNARQAIAAFLHCVDEADRLNADADKVSIADFVLWRKRNGYAKPLGQGSWNEALVVDIAKVIREVTSCDSDAVNSGAALWYLPLSGGQSLKERYEQLASDGVADAADWAARGTVILRRSLRAPVGQVITDACLEFGVAAFAERIGVGPKQIAGYLLPCVEEEGATGKQQIRRFIVTDESHVDPAELTLPDGTVVAPSDVYFNHPDSPSNNEEPFRPDFAITHIVAIAERCHGDCNDAGPEIFTDDKMPGLLANLVVTATENGLLHFDIKPSNMLYRKTNSAQFELHSLLYTDFDPDFVKIVPKHYVAPRVACLCVLQLSILIGTIRCDYAPEGAGLSVAQRRAYDFIRDALIKKYKGGGVEEWAQLCAEALFAMLDSRGHTEGAAHGRELRDALVHKHSAAGPLADATHAAQRAAKAAMELCPVEDAYSAQYANQDAYNKGVMGGPRKRIYHGPRAVINSALTHHIHMYLLGNPASGNGGTSKNRRCFDVKGGRRSTQDEQREPKRTLGQVVTDVFEFMLAGVQPREPSLVVAGGRSRTGRK